MLPNLKALREEMGLTRAQAAERCGVSVTFFWRLEEQKFGAGTETIALIEKGLGIHADQMKAHAFYGESPYNGPPHFCLRPL